MYKFRMPVRRAISATAGLFCALTLLAACTGAGPGGATLGDGTVVTYNQQVGPYSRSFVISGARTGEFYFQIYGQPFPQPMSDLQIAQYVTMPGWLGPTTPTTQPGPEMNRHFPVILVFNPAFRGPLTNTDCRNPGRIRTEPPRAGKVRVAAAFCIGNSIGSYLVAEQDGITGNQDPRFRRMLAQVMQLLLPVRDPMAPASRPNIPVRY